MHDGQTCVMIGSNTLEKAQIGDAPWPRFIPLGGYVAPRHPRTPAALLHPSGPAALPILDLGHPALPPILSPSWPVAHSTVPVEAVQPFLSSQLCGLPGHLLPSNCTTATSFLTPHSCFLNPVMQHGLWSE